MMAAFAGTAQVISADANGNVIYTGELTGADKDNFEACRCLNEDMPMFGISSFTEEKEDAKNGAFVKGSWSYNYYVDADDKPAGSIAFDFEYLVKDGTISYRYYNFIHSQEEEDPVFAPIGALPAVWDEKVSRVFTKEQYSRIQSSMTANVRVALKLAKKYCTTEGQN